MTFQERLIARVKQGDFGPATPIDVLAELDDLGVLLLPDPETDTSDEDY